MKRAPLRRKASLQARKPMRKRAPERRRPDGYADPDYLAWLRMQDCRVPGCSSVRVEAHHLRFDKNGNALGGHLKDDQRAISMCHAHHGILHTAPWSLRLYVLHQDLRTWQEEQLAAQRSQYLAQKVS